MAPPPSSRPTAAGFLWMCAIFVGAIGGIAVGQPSAGFVIGVVAGAAIALGLWLKDRERG
jgi:hypothetical protein